MDNTPTSNLIRNIFFAFAEFEKDMIIERTQEGKAIAKTKDGFIEGRPKKFTEEQIKHSLKLLENYSYKEVEKMTNISKSTLIRAKKRELNFTFIFDSSEYLSYPFFSNNGNIYFFITPLDSQYTLVKLLPMSNPIFFTIFFLLLLKIYFAYRL